MLKHLYIKNFTLIDQLDIDFRNGFSKSNPFSFLLLFSKIRKN
ncbi:hypothetical protein [Prevotella intermedia]|nr:hypothetical protein [Prevotella intermedia]